MTEFLSRIDWHNHDGINLSMINDLMRNQFYDRVLLVRPAQDLIVTHNVRNGIIKYSLG